MRKLPFAVRFWQGIRDWAEMRADESFMRWWRHERYCMQCHAPMLRECLTLQRSLNIRDDGEIHELGDCPRCHFTNRWFMGSMLPVGAPLLGSWQFLPEALSASAPRGEDQAK